MVMKFMKNQGCVFDKFCTYWIKILLEYINAKLGREDAIYYHGPQIKEDEMYDLEWGRWELHT